MLPFVIIAVIGILIGAFGFCLGLALLVNDNKRIDALVKECLKDEDDSEEPRELTEEDFAKRKRLEEVTKRSPLSFLFVGEGALLFLVSVLLLVLKVAIPSMALPWYGMLVIVLGIPLLSILVNGFSMMGFNPIEAEETVEDLGCEVEENSDNAEESVEANSEEEENA